MRRLLECLVSAAFSLTIVQSASAAVPASITVQGKLTDAAGVPLPAGPKSFNFKIFATPAGGGIPVWPSFFGEPQVLASDASGLWIALMGAVSPLTEAVFADTVRWLEVTVDGVTLPRVRLATGPYAHRVATVDGASGGTITSKVSIGQGHTNTGSGAFVAGETNTVSGESSTVPGGKNNIASGAFSGVSSGEFNEASGRHAIVGGGLGNYATDSFAFVGGGSANVAVAEHAVVGGGHQNRVEGTLSTIGGGDQNIAEGEVSTIGGGRSNQVEAQYGTIGGGYQNRGIGSFSIIGGGRDNRVDKPYATIGGGDSNIVRDDGLGLGGGDFATIGGGSANNSVSPYGVIGGGRGNYVSGSYSTIGGGDSNLVGGGVGIASTIAGGWRNSASGNGATVGGGWSNIAASRGSVSGGEDNRAESYGAIGGGYSNTSFGSYATIPGGKDNYAGGDYSLASGRFARVSHDQSFVWNSEEDTVESTRANQFLISASGGVRVSEPAGGAFDNEIGDVFQDNLIVAWGSVDADGSILADFGVSSISHTITGAYRINLNATASSSSNLAVSAILEVDAIPNSAATARLIYANMISGDGDSFDIFITNGSHVAVDNQFTFIVTAR